MSVSLGATLRHVADVVQGVVQGLLAITAVGLVLATGAAALGVLPWPTLSIFFGTFAVPQAGMWAQIAVTVLFVVLLIYLPANIRMSRLERSHRSFAIGMEDVSRAYRIAHASDRAGVFALSGEFDAMRARLEHLRNHPDLSEMEPELLQLAAQMSLQTRELARAYSDQKVDRARIFLRQRQEEAHALADRIALARQTCDELRRWMADIDAEERKNNIQIKRLEADLNEVLPSLGYSIDHSPDPSEGNVVNLPMTSKDSLLAGARETAN
jgi:hypothetical protein